ncbi:MAG: alkaline phosphatase family protein [Thermoplasmata archaeon]
MTDNERVLVIGLDSVPQGFVFERFLPQMPTFRRLLERGRSGTLWSTDPPITVPAWAVMFSGMDPGSLGLYGFHHRRKGTYWESYLPTPKLIRHPQVWDLLSQQGRRSCVIGMPPGYPPPKVNGVYISDFLTPKGAEDFVWPRSMVPEILNVAGGYDFDVSFRAEDRDRIGRQLFEMTRRRFSVARHLWKKEAWDFFAIHEIGPDRLHHTFWKYFDPDHNRYEPHPVFSALADEYYHLLDTEIASLLELVPPDVTVLLVSDHGSQAMTGCFCLNEWLAEKGYLTYRNTAAAPGTQLEKADIDWSRTKAWGAGGYYGRVFFNVRGREPEGIVAPDDIPELTRSLTADLEKVRRPDGELLGCRVLLPRETYRDVQGDPSDLMLYFGDLKWRSAGTVGHHKLFLAENDTGPDDAVHSFDGFFLLVTPQDTQGKRLGTQKINDIGPTLLTRMGFAPPAHMIGKAIPELL